MSCCLTFLKYSIILLVALLSVLFYFSSKDIPVNPKDITKIGGKYTTVDGRTIEYFVFGETDDKKYKHIVVEMNGLGGTGYAIREYFSELYKSLHIKAISITTPGHGGSSYVEDIELKNWHKDVSEVLKKENIKKKFWVKGSSLGCFYALALASSYGKERVEGFIGSACGVPLSIIKQITPEKAVALPKVLKEGMIGDAFWYLMSNLMTSEMALASNKGFATIWKKYPKYKQVMMKDMKRGAKNHKGFRANLKLSQEDWNIDLKSINTKSVIIYDKSDQLIDYRTSLWLGKEINAKIIEIKYGYGHASILDVENFKKVLRGIFEHK